MGRWMAYAILATAFTVSVGIAGFRIGSARHREVSMESATLSNTLEELAYIASMNVRYHSKMQAGKNGGVHAKFLREWMDVSDSIWMAISRAGITSETEEKIKLIRERIDDIERREEQPPNKDVLLESQYDVNESLWGLGIRTTEQCIAERERRAALKQRSDSP